METLSHKFIIHNVIYYGSIDVKYGNDLIFKSKRYTGNLNRIYNNSILLSDRLKRFL